MMNTITRVYELLDDRALSLTKLAEMSGVAYSTIKMAESPMRSPSILSLPGAP